MFSSISLGIHSPCFTCWILFCVGYIWSFRPIIYSNGFGGSSVFSLVFLQDVCYSLLHISLHQHARTFSNKNQVGYNKSKNHVGIKNNFICYVFSIYKLVLLLIMFLILLFRNTVIGMTATCARIGGILAPFCAQLDHVFPDLNLIVLGLASLLAGILTFKGITITYYIQNKNKVYI